MTFLHPLYSEKFSVTVTYLSHCCCSFVAYRFEDGTVSFLSTAALKHGFDMIESLAGSMTSISNYTFSLCRYCYRQMCSMSYESKRSLCQVYSDTDYADISTQGPVINFNLLDPDGNIIGYSQVSIYRANCTLRNTCGIT